MLAGIRGGFGSFGKRGTFCTRRPSVHVLALCVNECVRYYLYTPLLNHHVITPRGHVKDNESPLSVKVLLAA